MVQTLVEPPLKHTHVKYHIFVEMQTLYICVYVCARVCVCFVYTYDKNREIFDSKNNFIVSRWIKVHQ